MHETLHPAVHEAPPPHEGADPSRWRRAGSDQVEQPDEDQVVRELVSHGGYAWQGQLVEELDWSPAKTSRVLSAMESEGRIKRHRVGRKKAVCLPHRVPPFLDREVRDSSTS